MIDNTIDDQAHDNDNRNGTRLLVVDDDTRLRELLVKYLHSAGYEVVAAKDAQDARAKLAQYAVDLIVLDVMMPGETGLEFTSVLRRERSIPILMLTAMGESENRISGLEAGVDDYLVKPFEPRELVLRIENILRRTRGRTAVGIVAFGPFRFNRDTGELRRDDALISLTTAERKLLDIFVERLGEPVLREEISRKLQGISERSIDVQVTRLRRKLEDDPKHPQYLQTAWGAGYVLKG